MKNAILSISEWSFSDFYENQDYMTLEQQAKALQVIHQSYPQIKDYCTEYIDAIDCFHQYELKTCKYLPMSTINYASIMSEFTIDIDSAASLAAAIKAATEVINFAIYHECKYARINFRTVNLNGRQVMSTIAFDVLIQAYQEVLEYAKRYNVLVLMENHWGMSSSPRYFHKILTTLATNFDNFGFLHDFGNWKKEHFQAMMPIVYSKEIMDLTPALSIKVYGDELSQATALDMLLIYQEKSAHVKYLSIEYEGKQPYFAAQQYIKNLTHKIYQQLL